MELTVAKVATINVETHPYGSLDCALIQLHVINDKGDELVTLSLWGKPFEQIAFTFGEKQ